MQRNGLIAFFVAPLLAAILVLLVIYVFQINTLETRMIEQEKQLTALGESSDRLRIEVQKLGKQIQSGAFQVANSGTSKGSDGSEEDSARWLHPEVDNFLEPMDYVITLPEAETDGVLYRGYGSDPKGFNPLIENANDLSSSIVAYVGIGVAGRHSWTDPDKWYGDAAERVEITDDYKEYTIYLKKGIKWQKPAGVNLADPKYAWLKEDQYLTAHDLKFTLDIMMNPQVENGFIKNYYEDLDLERCEVADDYTIIIRWKKKTYISLSNTLGQIIMPEFFYAYDEYGERFPDETIGLRFNQHWYNHKGVIGAGPYRMAKYEPGSRIALRRYEDYHDELPAIKEIRMTVFSDPNVNLLKLKAHEWTLTSLRPSQYYEEIKKWEEAPRNEIPEENPFFDGNIQHKIAYYPAYYYVGWNADKPLFADKRVRQAMTFAFNRPDIITNVYHGLGVVSKGNFLPSGPYGDPEIEAYPFDLDKAKAILADAGWSDTDSDGLLDKDLNLADDDSTRTPFEFKLLIYSKAPEVASAANIFKEDLLSIGVKMTIDSAEWSLMQKRMNEKDFDAYTGGWALSWDIDLFQLWHSSQADIPKGSNYVGFRNTEADEIIVKLRETFDQDERIGLCRRFDRILYEEQPYTFFYVRKYVYCWWDELKRFELAITRPQTNSMPWWVASPAE